MLSNIAGRLSNSKSAITVEELDQSSKIDGDDLNQVENRNNLPQINSRNISGVAAVSAAKHG